MRMLDGGSATGMIDNYARLWHCSSTIFYYPHCLMLEAIMRRLMILDSQVLPRRVARDRTPGQTGPGAGMPDTARKDQMKVYLAWNLASGYPQQRVWPWSGEN